MPTGYTHAVQTGEVVSLRDFAMQCARNFGALILMRDEPSDAEIPDRFEPNTSYSDDGLAEAEKILAAEASWTDADCGAHADADYRAAFDSYRERESERYAQKVRYENMIHKVEKWKPRESVSGLKDFMLEQLRQSVKFDCDHQPDRPVRLTGQKWRELQLEKASRDLAYHTTHRDEEIERTKGRNEWLADLRASLPETT